MNYDKKKIWLIGSGPMAVAYIKVLQSMNVDFTVVGRGEESSAACFQATGIKPVTGGIDCFLGSEPVLPDAAIVAVGVEQLFNVSMTLLQYGVKKILVEKPGAVSLKEIEFLNREAQKTGAAVYIAYNRRFYASVQQAMQMIEKDGGVTSFIFEFTEWSHKIEPLQKAPGIKEKWFLANSTHVADLAFFIGGIPEIIDCHISGGLTWHPTGSVFTGSGKTNKNALFSYHADWTAAGRWGCEFLTLKNRYILKPLEELKIQKTGSIVIEDVTLDDALDKEFKPGIFKQVEDFFLHSPKILPTIAEQEKMVHTYYKIANY